MYSVFNLGARWGGWLTPRPCRFSPVIESVHIVQNAGFSSGRVWTSSKKPHSTEIRSPNPPVHRYSLYPLRYPGPRYRYCRILFSTAEKLDSSNTYPTISFVPLPLQNGISNIFHFNRTSIPFRSLPRSFRPPLHHFLSFQSPLRFPLQMLYCTK
jgi:hypothetical protein